MRLILNPYFSLLNFKIRIYLKLMVLYIKYFLVHVQGGGGPALSGKTTHTRPTLPAPKPVPATRDPLRADAPTVSLKQHAVSQAPINLKKLKIYVKVSFFSSLTSQEAETAVQSRKQESEVREGGERFFFFFFSTPSFSSYSIPRPAKVVWENQESRLHSS